MKKIIKYQGIKKARGHLAGAFTGLVIGRCSTCCTKSFNVLDSSFRGHITTKAAAYHEKLAHAAGALFRPMTGFNARTINHTLKRIESL